MLLLGIQSFLTYTTPSLLLFAFMKQNYKTPQHQSPELMHEAQRKRFTSKTDFNPCYGEKSLIVSYAPNHEKSIFIALSGHNSKQLQLLIPSIWQKE